MNTAATTTAGRHARGNYAPDLVAATLADIDIQRSGATNYAGRQPRQYEITRDYIAALEDSMVRVREAVGRYIASESKLCQQNAMRDVHRILSEVEENR